MEDREQEPTRPRSSPTWRRLLLAALVGTGLLYLLLFHPGSAPAGRRLACSNHLKQIALALHDYHQAYGCLPPAHTDGRNGKPMHSWRVLILPFLEHGDLYRQYDFTQPWNSPKNSLLAKHIPPEYRCPAARGGNPLATSYVAVVGAATAWPGRKSVRFQDIKDGTSDTILLVEIADSDINWMEPRDIKFDQAIVGVNMDKHGGIGSHHHGGANVVLADSSSRFLPDSVSPAALKALLTLADGETLDDDEDGRLFVRPPLPPPGTGEDNRE